MDWLDRFQQTFGQWYQSHFGVTEESELTPKDVLRSIIDAMEDSRSEGLDGRVYVPNKYVLELAVMNPEERAYLLSFLDEEELSAVLDRYMAHKNYFTRGPLDFTIEELDALDGEEKLYVRALFEKGSGGRPIVSDADAPRSAPSAASERIREEPEAETDPPTVEALATSLDDEALTVHAIPTAWAALLVSGIDGRRDVVSISKPVFCIGRSRHANNDLVLPGDGQVSKRHLRIELEPDGGATLYDLASTNGTFVNKTIVPVNITLRHGDLIEIGQTQIVFQRETEAAANPRAAVPVSTRREILEPTIAPRAAAAPDPPIVPPPAPSVPTRAPRLKRAGTAEEYIVGSEVLIGRSMTCDIVLSEPTVSTQQARIQTDTYGNLFIVDLSGRATTMINGRPLRTGERLNLAGGDRIGLGGISFVLEMPDVG